MRIKAIITPTPSEFTKGIRGMINNYANKCLNILAHELPERIKDVFKLEGAREGHSRWIETSHLGRIYREEYMKGNKAAYDYPTLIDTGELRESVDAEILEKDNDYFLVIGSELDYAPEVEKNRSAWHPRANKMIDIPGREWLFFTKGDELGIENVFNREEITELQEFPF